MTGRKLGMSLLIGALSGVLVTLIASGLSRSPITGFLEASPVGRASSTPSGNAASELPSVVPSIEVTAVPSSRPTVVPTSEPTSVPSPEPGDDPIAALTFVQQGVKAGLPAQSGSYGATTPVAATGQYISWRAVVGPDGSGQAIDVEVATRLNGTWTGWSRLTTRVADPDGTVVFTWRQQTPAWISVRFALPAASHSIALQGRWR